MMKFLSSLSVRGTFLCSTLFIVGVLAIVGWQSSAVVIRCHYSCRTLLAGAYTTKSLAQSAQTAYYALAETANQALLYARLGDFAKSGELERKFTADAETLALSLDGVLEALNADPLVDKTIISGLVVYADAAKTALNNEYTPLIMGLAENHGGLTGAAFERTMVISRKIAKDIDAVFLGIAAAGDEVYANYVVYLLDLIGKLRLALIIALIFSLIFIVLIQRLVNKQTHRLEELRVEAEAASRAKNNFLASMSHEIRTPMNAISGMSELLLRRDMDEESKGYVRDIKQASSNLLSIINDLLDFSKIEAGRLEIIPVTYYLSSLINDMVNIIRMKLVEKPIRFYTNIDAAIPNMLSGDVVRVRQIFLNLLGNAVKYTEKGFISVTITQDTRRENNLTLKIVVADSGFGIKPEDRQKLFGEFVQVDTHKNRGIEGTGLALAITRRLCVAMGGDISVESEYGKGSVFTVSVPQKIAGAQDVEMPFAAVDNPGKKKTLIFERRVIYAKSVAWSLKNIQVPHRLVTNLENFTEALRGEDWYVVFSGYGLYHRIRPVMEQLKKEFPQKEGPPLALMIEWGTEAYVPGVRFVSLPIQSLSISAVLNGRPDRRNYGESAFSGTRFTAPAARFLVVDDIATNLKVAEGLIAPYHARVDTALSGGGGPGCRGEGCVGRQRNGHGGDNGKTAGVLQAAFGVDRGDRRSNEK
ncbi:MAG: hypothetical protein LBP71_05320 [Spirochaetaceae bacterium]|jgi:signal transduction histidine kinase|nr:hypothetical protein [Spirochaetaceae bacterium]